LNDFIDLRIYIVKTKLGGNINGRTKICVICGMALTEAEADNFVALTTGRIERQVDVKERGAFQQ